MSRASLMPREHGAWVQIMVPLLTAVALAPSREGAALSVAAAAAFIAHESALILLGHRGARTRDRLRGDAGHFVLSLAAVGLGCGVLALVGASTIVWVGVAAAFAVSLALVPALIRRKERTTAAELIASLALSSWGIPVAVLGGLTVESAALVWAVWAGIFLGGTLCARGILSLASKRRPRATLLWLGGGLASGASIAHLTLWSAGAVGLGPALATLPTTLVGAICLWRRPPARRLMAVGISLGVASLVGAILLLALPLWPV